MSHIPGAGGFERKTRCIDGTFFVESGLVDFMGQKDRFIGKS